MAVTLNQMAQAYVANVQAQLQQAQQQAAQAQQIVEQITAHLAECTANIEANQPVPEVVQNEDGSTTETVPVNPFAGTPQ